MADSIQAAIVSYRRSGSISRHTLRMTDRLGLKATVIVAEEEYDEYVAALPGRDIAVGRLGMVENRHAMLSMFPAGTRVLALNDDMKDVVYSTGEAGRIMPLDPLAFHRRAEYGFSLLDYFGGAIWGINPSADRRFLANASQFSVGINSVEGCFFGFVAGQTDALMLPEDEDNRTFEDMERICKAWTAGWNIIRLNQISYTQSRAMVGGRGAWEQGDECAKVLRVVRDYPRVAAHTFSKLTSQPKCRVNIRRRCTVANPTSLGQVDELRDKIMRGPIPQIPPVCTTGLSV